MQRHILVIHTNDSLLHTWETELGNKFRLTNVQTLQDAEELFRGRQNFAAVVIDAFEEDGDPQAVSFIETLRNRAFTKPIIGIASRYQLQQKLVQAGCNLYATHATVPNRLCESLGVFRDAYVKTKPGRPKRSWKKTRRKRQDPPA